jgi:bifunctional UDP-N-acetylglucosamine pyrophosphorylase / glucosamine-1-phosphate N-acetyltransferase
MPQRNVVILAAGKGTRMKSARAKIMHEIMGKPMIAYVIERAKELDPAKIIVVIGHEKETVEAYLRESGVTIVVQEEQKGTAHALLAAAPHLDDGDVLVLYGDVPLITMETLIEFSKAFEAADGIAFMTTEVDDPTGYGRMILEGNAVLHIVEDADANEIQKKIRVINTGICMLRHDMLELARAVTPNNAKGEYYLTDICHIARQRRHWVLAHHHADAEEVLGINTRRDLLKANVTMRHKILDRLMEDGVSILDRDTYVDDTVRIGRDTIIYPHSFISGKTIIGEGVLVGPYVVIKDSVLADGVFIEGFSSLDGVTAEADVKIGPFSRLRPFTHLHAGVKIGNFVEVKNSVLDENTKANHLAYIGDATVGRNVNIGAGTITCNYDGKKKHHTTIGDGVFVGSNTELVAPVTIGSDAVIGAGSTITHDVPDGALAITRAKQKHIEGYSRRKK